MGNYKEYLICKERGHTSNGIMLPSNPPWSVCKYCGTHYRYAKPELIESNIPDKPAGHCGHIK